MEQSTKEAWKRLLDEARRELPDATVRTWLEPAVPIALDDGRLIVGAPDQFAVEWNESKHASVLARAAESVFGRPTAIVFRVQEDRQQRPQMDFFVAPREPATVDKSGVPTTPLNERYTFQTFVIGKSNELAAAAAHAVAEAPGKTYNPLFIYGATGLGKTHLMQAIAHAVLEKHPETRLQYFGAEQFINDVIESIHARTMSEFRRRYRNDVDLLLVDDVHFLEGKEMTQEEFFHTFNALFEGHKQIVLTSDRPPKEIPGLEDRLISASNGVWWPTSGTRIWNTVSRSCERKRSRIISSSRFRTTCYASSRSTSARACGSSRAVSSSCCSSPRSRTARSPSSSRARRCRTRFARGKTRRATARSRRPASIASRRWWHAAGASPPKDCAPRPAPKP